jgi:hypothetical protein
MLTLTTRTRTRYDSYRYTYNVYITGEARSAIVLSGRPLSLFVIGFINWILWISQITGRLLGLLLPVEMIQLFYQLGLSTSFYLFLLETV